MSRTRPLARNMLFAAIAATSIYPSVFVHADDTDESSALEEIVVSARRSDENVQEVPVSLQVITADSMQDMAMTSPTELAKLTPGLTVALDNNPANPVIVLRGVRWTQASGTPAIPIYFNEISFDPVQVLQTMYDIDKVEVLRGPQGTTRGAPSISGAVTMETRRPDTYEIGGYISGLAGENQHRNLQGAVNLPLIKDKLAVRVAANAERQDGLVDSVNSSANTYSDLNSGRVAFYFEPREEITADLMFQRTTLNTNYFTQLAGSGYAGNSTLGIPANYNGPEISARDYQSAGEVPNHIDYRADLITFNFSWNVAGHVLTYDFGSQKIDGQSQGNVTDPGNILAGFDYVEPTHTNSDDNSFYVHDLRLSSDRNEDNFIDYDVGAYRQTAKSTITNDVVGAFLPGALGNPQSGGAPSPFVDAAAITRSTLYAISDIRLRTENYSFYGNLDFHLPHDTEITVGARSIHDTKWVDLSTTTTPAYASFINPVSTLTCSQLANLTPDAAGAIDSPNYASGCDVPVPAMDAGSESHKSPETATIYNVSISRQFAPDLMAYFTTGTSWRQGLPAIGNPGLPSSALVPKPEEATSYELGVKSTFANSVRINTAIFQIDYDNQLNQFQFIPYYNLIGQAVNQTGQAFYSNLDSQVRGAELEISARPISPLTLSTNISYSEIVAKSGSAPCSDTSRPLSASNPINYCEEPGDTSLNGSPKLQVSFNGSYEVTLGEIDGYLRWVVNYQGKNENYATSIEPTSSYTLVDLFLGIRGKVGEESGWDVGFYGKNVFDRQIELTRNSLIERGDLNTTFGSSGYDQITAVRPRELGLSARYSFGSR